MKAQPLRAAQLHHEGLSGFEWSVAAELKQPLMEDCGYTEAIWQSAWTSTASVIGQSLSGLKLRPPDFNRS